MGTIMAGDAIEVMSYPGGESTLDGHLAGHDGEDLGALFADVVEPLERLIRVAALALQTAPEQHGQTNTLIYTH